MQDIPEEDIIVNSLIDLSLITHADFGAEKYDQYIGCNDLISSKWTKNMKT